MPSPTRRASRRRPGAARTPLRRRAVSWRPAPVEALEGRTLLSVSPLDPTFHGGTVVVNRDAPGLTTATAVATQRDGKVVVIGNGSTAGASTVLAQRYNVDGTPDATFGVGGRATIPLPAGSYRTPDVSTDLLIQDDGRIVLSFSLSKANIIPPAVTPVYPYVIPVEAVVARLNTDGTPDAAFGTGGEVVIAAPGTLSRLALQKADGKILVGGTVDSKAVVTRLDVDGSVDPAFNGGALLTLEPGTFNSATGGFTGGYGPTASLAACSRPPGARWTWSGGQPSTRGAGSPFRSCS